MYFWFNVLQSGICIYFSGENVNRLVVRII